MDISTLELPLRTERRRESIFSLRPALGSVNVSYETAEAHQDTQESIASLESTGDGPKHVSEPGYDQRRLVEDELPHEAASPATSFSSSASPKRSARVSFSLAAAEECQAFVASLKEPKYAKPMSPDELAWMFQDFYMKLRQDLLGSEDELLTATEQETRRHAEQQIDAVLDKAEKAVVGGELYQKLFALGPAENQTHDAQLQHRIDQVRAHPELIDALAQTLQIRESLIPSTDSLSSARYYLSRLNKETAPKTKTALLVKAHHAIVEAFPQAQDADSVLPLFVLALATSDAENWWQTLLFIQRFRRAAALVGQAAYCVTNLEAAIHVFEQFTPDAIPETADKSVFAKPLTNPRAPRMRSSSQSSRGSNSWSAASQSGSTAGSFTQRVGETLSTYRSMLMSARRPSVSHPAIDQRLVNADADSLTLADVRTLLREYKKLAEYVEGRSAELRK